MSFLMGRIRMVLTGKVGKIMVSLKLWEPYCGEDLEGKDAFDNLAYVRKHSVCMYAKTYVKLRKTDRLSTSHRVSSMFSRAAPQLKRVPVNCELG